MNREEIFEALSLNKQIMHKSTNGTMYTLTGTLQVKVDGVWRYMMGYNNGVLHFARHADNFGGFSVVRG